MSEQKEICPKCGSVDFGILRDMTSRRVCKCGHGWDAPEKKYISPHLLVHKELWNQVSERYDKLKSDYDALKQLSDAFYLKQVQLENQNEDIKAKLEKAESVISFYANKRHWDYTRIQMVEDMEMHGFGNLGGFKAREYMKG